jgi:hypothetical protein
LGYLTAAKLDCESALYHVPNLPRAKLIQQEASERIALNETAVRKDYYRILGLERGRLTHEEIEAAYTQMKAKYSPERIGPDRSRLLLQDVAAVISFQENLIQLGTLHFTPSKT